MQDELKDIAYVFYVNNVDGKIHTCNISNKEELDCNNYPRYLGQYENCLIALKNQKITDKLYLMTEETFRKIKKKFWYLDMYLAKEFLDRYADKVIAR
ncbi:MAG: hypothetical protein BHW64_01840 [Candidatus Melainabacteria bacterium LEY3_CP_29_8]|nr:MAG: hypothetical protein BHW64_01840 [Candidatus Melainabacteria bacterium LEY3_CP_29_8]